MKLSVFSHYFKSIGLGFTIISILGNLIYQGFAIGSNVWLSVWSSDENAVCRLLKNINSTYNTYFIEFIINIDID